jgi:hypothetical protein
MRRRPSTCVPAHNLGLATALDTTAVLPSQQHRWGTAARAAAAADALRRRIGLPASPVTRDLAVLIVGDRDPAVLAEPAAAGLLRQEIRPDGHPGGTVAEASPSVRIRPERNAVLPLDVLGNSWLESRPQGADVPGGVSRPSADPERRRPAHRTEETSWTTCADCRPSSLQSSGS